MSSSVYMDFSDWLLQEMNKHNWSQADLSRASGVDRQVISNYINRRRTNPDPDVLAALAKGLNLSPITIYRKAGLLPDTDSKEIRFDDWKDILEKISSEDEAELRQIAEMKIRRREKEQALKILKPKKTG